MIRHYQKIAPTALFWTLIWGFAPALSRRSPPYFATLSSSRDGPRPDTLVSVVWESYPINLPGQNWLPGTPAGEQVEPFVGCGRSMDIDSMVLPVHRRDVRHNKNRAIRPVGCPIAPFIPQHTDYIGLAWLMLWVGTPPSPDIARYL